MKKSIAVLLALLCLLPFSLVPSAAGATAEKAVELGLPCKGAILMEETTGQVLFESDADAPMPIASVTKIMTLLLVMDEVEKGTLSLTDPVPISENAANMGGSQVYLEVGERITLHEVLKAVFISSANDGAVALAELVSGSVEAFVAAMNERAAALGMKNTLFVNPTGLDDTETGHSSARDVALMSRALKAHKGVTDYTTLWIDSIRDGAFGLANTNKLIRFYSGATGLKTGSTAKAKYCVSATAERGGLRLIAVVLGSESSAERFRAAKKLLDHGFAHWTYYQPEDLTLPVIPVWGGTKKELHCTAQTQGLVLKKSDGVGIETKVYLTESLTAPVAQGQSVGKICYEKEGKILMETPIFSAEEVEALGLWDVFFRLIRQLLNGGQIE